MNINFSGTSNVTWTYNPTTRQFERFYNGTTPDTLADGTQNAAANVVVQYVHISYGPWLENSEGGLEVQADLYPDASGQAQVFRNGVEITGTWQRSALGSPTQFLTAAGTPITMQPGQTVGRAGARHDRDRRHSLTGPRREALRTDHPRGRGQSGATSML